MRWLLLVALAVSACGSDVIPEVDSGTPDTSVEDGVMPPQIPWLSEGVPPLALSPCPEGWHEVVREHVECEPYPETGPLGCGPGEAHFPGEASCRPLGVTCPSSDFAAALPSADVLYVRPGATGGDGSASAPFGVLSDVPWSTLGPGDTVALAKGRFPGVIPLRAGVQLVGACAAETILVGADPPLSVLISVQNGGSAAQVREVTIERPAQNGVVIDGARAIELEAVEIVGATGRAIYVQGTGGSVSLRDVLIRETRESSIAGGRGRGLALEGGTVDAQRVIFDDNVGIAIDSVGDGVALSVSDAVIRGTRPNDTGNAGLGFFAEGRSSRFTLSRVLFEENHDISIVAEGAETEVILSDVIIDGTRPTEAEGVRGRGITLQAGAQLTAERIVLSENHSVSMFVSGEGTHARLTDVVIRDTQPEEMRGRRGYALALARGGAVDASRVSVTGNRTTALTMRDFGSRLDVEDLAIRGTLPSEIDGSGGRGIVMTDDADLTARRVYMTGNHDIGLLVTNATARVEDVVIRDPVGTDDDPIRGAGLQAQVGGSITGSRISIENTFTLGCGAVKEATLELSDLSIRSVQPSSCATTTCPDEPYGYGIVAGASRVALTRFEIVNSALCGMLLTTSSSEEPLTAEFEGGLVSGSPLGVCVQVEGVDVASFGDGVRFMDNGTNLDTTSLPVPGVPEASEL